MTVPFEDAAIRSALKRLWNRGRPLRFKAQNIYGDGRTAQRIANILATVRLDEKMQRKLIAY